MRINIRKVKGFINRHKISSIIVLVAMVATIGYLFYDFRNIPIFNENGFNLKPKETRIAAPLTGLLVDRAMAERRPIAVVIENSPDARPQSGYNDADVVYETLAEGGITRTLAFFQSKNSNEIGPVRSARPYFIDWLSEVNALFAHVGGSIDAFDAIEAYNIADLNQFYFGNYFWRSSDRFAPHNVYTTVDRLYSAAKSAGYETKQTKTEWHDFKDDASKEDRGTAQTVTVNFSGPLFTSKFVYNPTTNDYTRYVANVLQKDKKTGQIVKTKNIVVLYQTVGYGVTRAGEQKVNIGTIGKGTGFVFLDGKATKIRWEKKDRTSLTKLFNEAGEEIKLNRGQTWIEVPPVGANVTY